MNWIEAVGGIWLQSIGWMAGLCIVFLALTRFCPCNPGRNWWTDRRAARTDLAYWLVLPVVMQLGRVAFLVIGALGLSQENLASLKAASSLSERTRFAVFLPNQSPHSPHLVCWTATKLPV